MILWLDAHLSPRIANWITDRFGLDAKPVRELGLRHAKDPAIWDAARKADAIVMTKDADFAEQLRRIGPRRK